MGNLVALIVELCQNWLAKKLAFSEELQSTVMEVRIYYALIKIFLHGLSFQTSLCARFSGREMSGWVVSAPDFGVYGSGLEFHWGHFIAQTLYLSPLHCINMI